VATNHSELDPLRPATRIKLPVSRRPGGKKLVQLSEYLPARQIGLLPLHFRAMKSEPISARNLPPGEDDDGFNDRLYLALARHRRRTGARQYELAARIGVSPSELCRWIYGGSRPSSEKAKALANQLRMSPEELFPERMSAVELGP
jgi:DNA-binding XRE family transcriptional regulator